MFDFHNQSQMLEIAAAQAAAQTEIDCTAIDALGLEAISFLVATATLTAGTIVTAKIFHSDTLIGGYVQAKDQAGNNALVVIADTNSNKLVKFTARKFGKRYVQLQITRTTQNAAFNRVWAELHPASKPATQASAAVLDGGLWLALS